MADPGMSDVHEMERQPGAAVMHGNVPNIWSSTDLGTQLETPAVNLALTWRQNSNPSYESDHAMPHPGPIPRVQQEYLNQVTLWIRWKSRFPSIIHAGISDEARAYLH